MCFFFNDTATTEIYTLSLHDALPICAQPVPTPRTPAPVPNADPSRKQDLAYRAELGIQRKQDLDSWHGPPFVDRSEEHTSELQSRQYLVCRLLLEKKKFNIILLLVLI